MAAIPIYYHTIYQTTNLINGKFYIGKHSTTDPYDDYLGSGTILKEAIKKYSLDNFKKEILFCAFTEEDALYVEENIFVTEKEVNDPNCYNTISGGQGSSSNDWTIEKRKQHSKILSNTWTEERKNIQRKLYTGSGNPMYNKERPDMKENHWMKKPEYREYFSKITKGKNHHGKNNPMFGKKQSEETKEKLSGENNPTKRENVKEKMRKPKSKITCPHCGLTGGSNNMTRYHFDNCKYKK